MMGTDLRDEKNIENREYVRISLRIWNSDPVAISDILGLQPTSMCIKGEVRTTPSGRRLDSVHRDSVWSYELPISDGTSVLESITQVDDLLLTRQHEIDQLRSEGAKVEYFLGVFLDGHHTICFSPELMERWGQRGINIVLNIYVPDPKEEKGSEDLVSD